MKIRKFMITTIHEYLNEQNTIHENNFKNWFGNSVVVQDGKPLIVYHFGNNVFSSFEPKIGINTNLFTSEIVNRQGFFFSPNEKFSNQYGKEKYELFLRINNVFDLTKHYYYNNITVKSSELFDEFIDFVENIGINLSMEYQSYSGELTIKPEYNWKFFDGELGEKFISFLKSKGYDGVHFIEEDIPIFVVFKPNQIKSVKNDGSWDINNNNIYS